MANVAFDASALLLALAPEAKPPLNPETKRPVAHAAERVRHLLETLIEEKARIIVPAPAFSEIIMHVSPEMGEGLHEFVRKTPRLNIAPFDLMTAYELAEVNRDLSDKDDKRGGIDENWQRIKFDRQILAVARVHEAVRIYSDDKSLGKAAERLGIPVIKTADLPLPPENPQGSLFEPPTE